ncbi:MAG TPA: hypothetical protein VMD91_00385 [Candidatus Sulfotelmatobacter sp.]|nr:hypothetical protein [Candidatus Sulfotelmatobacter sp.]
MKRLLVGFCLVVGLAACSGGGGGGGGTAPPPTATPTPASVTGDMLAYAPSRGWNYQGEASGEADTLTLYAEPDLIDGYEAFVLGVSSGTEATLLTSEANFYDYSAADMGVTSSASGYNVGIEASAGGTYVVPGNPLLVPTTLTAGQTWSPYAGVTATVTSVGTVPGASVCPTPATGAVVQYAYSNLEIAVSYVPGCGITGWTGPNESFTLVSTATYASIGQTSIARKLEGLTMFDTVKSLLGLNRQAFPGSARGLSAGLFRR